MGHVNNANHITYIEMARLKYFEDVVQADGNWSLGSGLILARTEIDYKKPILLHDSIFVYTRCSKIGSKSLTLEWEIIKEQNTTEEIMASGIAVVVYFDYKNNQTIAIPELHKDIIRKYEGIDSLG